MALARTMTGRGVSRGMKANHARDRLDAALARIDDLSGEGSHACLTVYREAARAAADAADARARAGISLGPLDGVIVSIKDMFDVAGEVTRAGSKVLAEEGKPAAAAAPVVRRLRSGGAVIVAKTNMTEFAFSGVGINPHYGTPGNPADRQRIPGGSTSGGAVAVADGMCEIAIGSDTGGSTRIPGALCGLVGFKPSRQRISPPGPFPLSPSIDSVGPIARSVMDCVKADAVMAGDDFKPLEPAPLANLRIGIAQGLPLENLDETVAKRFPHAIDAPWSAPAADFPTRSWRCSTAWSGSTAAAVCSRRKPSPCIATGLTGVAPTSMRTCARGWSGPAASARPITSRW